MFRHRGKARTLKHNLAIASLLSLVAGIVNVVGFLSIQQLTTNVTGHFAFMMEEVLRWELWKAQMYFLFIIFFLLGAFCSNLMVELRSRNREANVFVPPVVAEALLLLAVAVAGDAIRGQYPSVLAFMLLFAMGMQNSLVTTISNSLVRTTHLTGLFTDLGIELSQLFFYKRPDQRKKLISSIRLRIRIITFFFLGGVAAGFLYSRMGIYTLIIPSLLLAFGIIYDSIKFRVLLYSRSFKAGRQESH
jgi:uncharacterized membrane protein YoaK (UPF0700 family)